MDHRVTLEQLWCLEEAITVWISAKVQSSSVVLERVSSQLVSSDKDCLALRALECVIFSVLVDVCFVAIASNGVWERSNAKSAIVALLRLDRQDQLLVVGLMLLIEVQLELLKPVELQAAVLAEESLEMTGEMSEKICFLAINSLTGRTVVFPVLLVDVSLKISLAGL